MTSAELGGSLRRWRDRVAPAQVGLPAGGQRRAAGLRREELALLAGISVDYITRLEQGRAANPSTQVIEALARALRLSTAEREHLFRLCGAAPPGPDHVPEHIPASVQRILDRLAATPAAVYDATWNLLLANPPYAALMGDPSAWRGVERNAVWRHFLGPGGRARLSGPELAEFEAALAADLRTAAARYPADPRLKRLIAQLRAGSPRFAELWERGAVGVHEHARKTIDHPEVGPVALDCDILAAYGSDLRIMVYTAEPDTEDADRLRLITVLGTQAFAES